VTGSVDSRRPLILLIVYFFISPHPESDTVSQEKHSLKNRFKNVWIKWPTRVKIVSFISYLMPSFMPLTVISFLVIISFP